MAKVYFYNENCIDNLKRMAEKNYKIDLVLTSPPYATSRSKVKTQKAFDDYNRRYDICLDDLTPEQYGDWTVDIFNHLDKVLAQNGVVLYNISYGSENPDVMWLAIADIIRRTPFQIADCIVWKKRSALPNNSSPNKLTRITEFVFVICRKDEYLTYTANKKVKSVREDTGQKYYENMFNFIVAPNNDGPCNLNKATYSSDLCVQLLNMYAKPGMKVFDPFMGSGTTGIAVEKFDKQFDGQGLPESVCIGCELSAAQVQFSKDRLAKFRGEKVDIVEDKEAENPDEVIKVEG